MNKVINWLSLVTFSICFTSIGMYSIVFSSLRQQTIEAERLLAEEQILSELDKLVIYRLYDALQYEREYNIPMDLALLIYDVALAEGLSVPLAFRLVDVESAFDSLAVSRVGAIGLTQLMPNTARSLMPEVTRKELYSAELNLRLGFRYLKFLLEEYNGDMRVALLAYNRGPARVNGLVSRGRDPANGYARAVCRGNCEVF